MLHKKLLAVGAAMFAAAAMLVPTTASARVFWGSGLHGHFRDFGQGFRFYGAPVYYYGDYGCWRWVPTRFGPAKVWVC